jgi:D-sedoheptulose 7-phosphate isomerase
MPDVVHEQVAEHPDLALIVPSATTARVQEMHLLPLHVLSEAGDALAAGEPATNRGNGG